MKNSSYDESEYAKLVAEKPKIKIMLQNLIMLKLLNL